MSTPDTLDTEIELIAASLLPEETLVAEPSDTWPRDITITNGDSQRCLHIRVDGGYPARDAVSIHLSGNDIGRDDASEWRGRIREHLGSWSADEDYPLYTAVTAIVPLLVPDSSAPEPKASNDVQAQTFAPPIPHHALLTSHHLLSPTKRKNFQQLASQLSLTGFSKVGHPGIYYAIGEEADLEVWLREVKSWNWLALRVRVGIEPVPGGGAEGELEGKGKEDGARGGKGRGDWVELERISEALEWLRRRGRDKMLVDIGIGGGGG